MVWNQLERLIAEIPERLTEFEKQKEVIARLEDEAFEDGSPGQNRRAASPAETNS